MASVARPGEHRGAVRTAVVRDALDAALAERVAGVGRDVLDVVDAGGGTGGFAVPLAEHGHRVTVVDPSPDALAALERRADEAGVRDRVRAVQGDVAGLLDAVEASSADVVLCHGVLEHVDDPVAALVACHDVLRPAGLLSLLVAQRAGAILSRAVAGHLDQARHLLADPDGRWGPSDPLPRRFDADQLDALLRDTGFVPGRVDGVRVLADLVPAALVDGEPGAVETLLDLERCLATDPVLRAIATSLHVLATRA